MVMVRMVIGVIETCGKGWRARMVLLRMLRRVEVGGISRVRVCRRHWRREPMRVGVGVGVCSVAR